METSITFNGFVLLSSKKANDPFWNLLDKHIKKRLDCPYLPSYWYLEGIDNNNKKLIAHRYNNCNSISYILDLVRILSYVANYNSDSLSIEDSHITYNCSPPSTLGGSFLLNSDTRFITRKETIKENGKWITKQLQLGY